MNEDDIEDKVFAYARVAIQNAPCYGSTGITLHYCAGKLSRIQTDRCESVKASDQHD